MLSFLNSQLHMSRDDRSPDLMGRIIEPIRISMTAHDFPFYLLSLYCMPKVSLVNRGSKNELLAADCCNIYLLTPGLPKVYLRILWVQNDIKKKIIIIYQRKESYRKIFLKHLVKECEILYKVDQPDQPNPENPHCIMTNKIIMSLSPPSLSSNNKHYHIVIGIIINIGIVIITIINIISIILVIIIIVVIIFSVTKANYSFFNQRLSMTYFMVRKLLIWS